MYRAARVRGVFFLSAFLLLMIMVLMLGCAVQNQNTKIDAAERSLSQGKVSHEDLKAITPIFPPSLVARHKIALIMDAIIKGESSLSSAKSQLEEMQGKTLTPDYLKVEAGYLINLIERMEILQKSAAGRAKELTKENEELRHSLDQTRKEIETLKKENEDIKKEIGMMGYKLKKLEQIHIESVKRRGKQ